MKKNMLKLAFFGLFIFALSFNANAQLRIGGGILLNTEAFNDIGLNVRLETSIGESLIIAPNINYFFSKNGITTIEFNGDLHYPIEAGDAITAYPLAGLNVSRFSGGFASSSEVGLNLGGGINFGISDAMRIFAELKYVLLFDANGYGPLIIGGGLLFDIGG